MNALTPSGEPILAELARQSSLLTFDEKKHAYRYNGEVVPSVTQILKVLAKDALVPWAAKLQSEADKREVEAWVEGGRIEPLDRVFKRTSQAWKKKQTDAADVGTEVHALVEAYSRGLLGESVEMSSVSDEALLAYEGFVAWAKEVGYRPVAVEARLYCSVHKYAGTADVIGYFDNIPELDGKLTVADWKTAKGLYPEHDLQNIAYRLALLPDFPCRGLVVRLPKDSGPIEHHVVRWTTEAYEAWLGALSLYRWSKAK